MPVFLIQVALHWPPSYPYMFMCVGLAIYIIETVINVNKIRSSSAG